MSRTGTMLSKASDSANKLTKFHVEGPSDGVGSLEQKMHQLKLQIQAERVISVKEKVEKNREKVEGYVSKIISETARANLNALSSERNRSFKLFSSRIEQPLCRISGFVRGCGEKDWIENQEVLFSSSTKLPLADKIPPYTTWIFLDRNQRMAEDQSVVGRRRIYYDEDGSEALVYSGTDDEAEEPEEVKHEFSAGEDRILLMAFQEHGLGEEVVELVKEFIGVPISDILARYNTIKERNPEKCEHEGCISLDKSLNAALDSFDNLFCRRCLVFDCRLHGCSQPLIYPSEKSHWSGHDENREPCSDQCYLRLSIVTSERESAPGSSINAERPSSHGGTGLLHNERSIPGEAVPATSEAIHSSHILKMHNENTGKRKVVKHTDKVANDLTIVPDAFQGSSKKQKRLDALDLVTATSEPIPVQVHISRDEPRDVTEVPELRQTSKSTCEQVEGIYGNSEWKPVEKDLYMKGLQIFGRNSCLIARNLLSGLRTCMEVSSYMHNSGASMPNRSVVGPSSFMEDNVKSDMDQTEQEMSSKPRLLRRRGKARRLKYSWKSAGHPTMWKRIADGKNDSRKLYTPCGCQSMCGKECPCMSNGTCCEKYCGCSKSCKNRFRGCHCAKSQCRSRQCPCFAAGRECDPDVCRHCWVSCGDGSLGEPPRQGDSQCGNMRLLLRQQQRILLGKSDVAGWGAFLKNPVNKNDYLGEYTGEIISHQEADKRGKIYDRVNSSFLFDLNEQYVLDAYRKGDKLKFANHSSNPNCHAKVMLVAGDHRVGIFAKEHIDAGEELFYDYCYLSEAAPVWAQKPEGSKRDDSSASRGRAKKHQPL
ncbi:histone-lysine N-methyltransferase EZA1-like [Pyrus ussuriensis x Pyrus communis]|uniref:Histone-lysine N-methyltransferase EZA1-like n=1 Tax=Pyrus ussuriensis x Pyrus communis TaxID=2448454 RepID=A0A5N5FPK7_9ROSA|nr:histone-lysine N-methyltransferase EZA1-like [Pyrus ussuriensis x Pyrus communis]